MSLKERVYSVLIVSSAGAFNTAVTPLLSKATHDPVDFVSSVSAAKRAVSQRSYDFVIINAPLQDEYGTRFAVDISQSESIVLLLVKSEIHAEIYEKVVEHGIFTLPKPTSKPVLVQALDWMASAREHSRRFEKKTLTIEEKMKEIRLINRAKCLLISELNMSEAQAHRHIEKQAMDRCVSRRKIAEEIIENTEKGASMQPAE